MREIISNIIRHAKATRVDVVTKLITGRAGPICLIEVRDNGIGLELDYRKGNGLTNICARMTEIGGKASFDTLSVGNEADAQKLDSDTVGMRVSLELPISPL